MSSFSATRCTKNRNPTPCTVPETKYRLVCFPSLTNFEIVAETSAILSNSCLPNRAAPSLEEAHRLISGKCAKLNPVRAQGRSCSSASSAHLIFHELAHFFSPRRPLPLPAACRSSRLRILFHARRVACPGRSTGPADAAFGTRRPPRRDGTRAAGSSLDSARGNHQTLFAKRGRIPRGPRRIHLQENSPPRRVWPRRKTLRATLADA